MRRLHGILGIVTGVVLLASAAMHSLMGWPSLRASLAKAGVAPDLITGLGIGWNFGGMCMTLFGVLALWLFGAALRRRPVSLRPLVLIGFAYAAFGVGALLVGDMNPFFLIFVVPGLMLAAAAWGGETRATAGAPADA